MTRPRRHHEPTFDLVEYTHTNRARQLGPRIGDSDIDRPERGIVYGIAFALVCWLVVVGIAFGIYALATGGL